MRAVTKLLLLSGTLLFHQGHVRAVRTSLPDLPLSDRDLNVRAGYYTDTGKYLGGIPGYNNMYEFFDCTEYMYDFSYGNTGGIATVCKTWVANEVGSQRYDTARCSCQSIKDAAYCDVWTCSHIDVYNPFSCSGSELFCYVQKEVRTTECMCVEEAYSGRFCESWTCLDIDSDGNGNGSMVFETYTCVTTSPTADFCVAWTGEIDTSNAIGLSTCACVQRSTSSSVCSSWECQMRGMDKCSSAGSGWCNIGVAVGVGGLFGSLGAWFAAIGLYRFLSNKTPIYRSSGLDYLVGFSWMSAWSIGVVIWGGEDGAIYVTFWWMSMIAIGLLCGCYVKGWQEHSFASL